jgi:hypothetical protein
MEMEEKANDDIKMELNMKKRMMKEIEDVVITGRHVFYAEHRGSNTRIRKGDTTMISIIAALKIS